MIRWLSQRVSEGFGYDPIGKVSMVELDDSKAPTDKTTSPNMQQKDMCHDGARLGDMMINLRECDVKTCKYCMVETGDPVCQTN